MKAAKKSPDRFPPLVIVSGGQDLLRRRFVEEVIAAQRSAGWDIQHVDGTDPGAVQDALVGDMFSPRETLAVVSSPEKVPLEVLEKHHTSQEYLTTLLLHIEGEPDGRTKFGKLVKGAWGSQHRNFPTPSEWKATGEAAEFVQQEMKRHGLEIASPLAMALVERSGADLGVLAFEVLKIATLAKLDKVMQVEPRHVARGMAPIAEASVQPISDALSGKNAKKLLRALQALRRSSKDDPTMRVSRLLGSMVTKWVQAVYLDALPPKAAAEELGVHPWYFENKILPAAKMWGKKGAVRLVGDLAAAERAVLNGAIDPWTVLTTRLMAAVMGVDDTPPVRLLVKQDPLVVMDFVAKSMDEAVSVSVDPAWHSKVQDFVTRQEKLGRYVQRAKRDGKPQTEATYAQFKEQDIHAKLTELGVERVLRTRFGHPPKDIDFEDRDGDAGYEPDIDYTDVGGPRYHIKHAPSADTREWGYSAVVQWCNKKDKPSLAEACAARGCDDLFRVHAEKAGWVDVANMDEDLPRDEKYDRKVIQGVSHTPDYLVSATTKSDEQGVPVEILILFSVRWGWVLQNNLVERLSAPSLRGHVADIKGAVYWYNLQYVLGLGFTYFDTTLRQLKGQVRD